MEANMGNTDRIIRFFLGLVLVIAPFANIPPIWTSNLLVGLAVIVGVVFMVTSFIRFCPLYRVFGFSTCKT